MCAFDSHCGYVTVENETKVEAAVEASDCMEYCCTRGPRRTKEEADAAKARRQVGYDNAARLLEAAEEEVAQGEVERAKVYVEIAQAWDTVSY